MTSHSDLTEPNPLPLNKPQHKTLAAVGRVIERLGTGESTNDIQTVNDAKPINHRNRQTVHAPAVQVQRIFKYRTANVSQTKERHRDSGGRFI